MRRITFIEALGFLIKALVVIFVVLYTASLFSSYGGYVESKFLEKFTVEMSNNVLSHALTSDRVIFNQEQLEQHNGINIEPYDRACNYAYHVKVICLDKDKCDDLGIEEEYSFGYEREDGLWGKEIPTSLAYSINFPVAIESVEGIIPASAIITSYKSVLTTISCMTETAYKTKLPQETTCLFVGASGSCEFDVKSFFEPKVRLPKITDEGDKLCFYIVTSTNMYPYSQEGFFGCRYLPDVDVAGIEVPLWEGGSHPETRQIFRAVPIISGCDTINRWKCEDIQDCIADESYPDIEVAYCFDNG
ncbi:hypothetical protein ACFLQN_03495 [Candidatus Aenigmatarchaeota archaeon]